jgi:hypothetical protein
MDNSYEPSFEVVDKVEEAEDYLLAKNRRNESQKQPPDRTENHNTIDRTDDDDTMKFNNLPFTSDTSVVKNEVNQAEGNVDDVANNDIPKCITEDEEGQEALWLEEAAMTPSASSGTVSPEMKPPSKRKSFLFGNSKQTTTMIPPRRTISFRKKKNQPKIVLLDEVKNGAPAVVPIVSDEVPITNNKEITTAPPVDGVIASDTISSLGFDKSFDVKSPLSMSSLNEILDAPLTPSVEESKVLPVTDSNMKTKKKSIIRGMFEKKEKKVKAKKSFSFGFNRSRYARSVTIVEKDDNEDDDDAVIMDPMLLATRDINERIQASLLRAMENDDVQSLTSYNGVPVIMKEDETKKKKDRPRSFSILPGQKPLNFDKVKPTFVNSKDSLSMAEIQEKFVPMDDEDDEDYNEEAKDSSTPTSKNDSCEQDGKLEPLKSSSPNSNGDDSAVTDRYTVTRGVDDDFESDDDDGKSDKYSVIPDPCSLCDSFWISTEHQQTVSKTMTESPETKPDPSKNEPDTMFDSPVLDKYAELPEVVATDSSGTISGSDVLLSTEQVSASTEESTSTKPAVFTSKSRMSSVFGKFKRTTLSTETQEVVSDNSIGVMSPETETVVTHLKDTSATDELSLSRTEQFASVPTEPTTLASKSTKSSFFGKFKRQTTKSTSCEVTADPTISGIESSVNESSMQNISNSTSFTAPSIKAAPKKSILKKRKEVMVTPIETPNESASIIVNGNDLESPGAKISVLSLGSEQYTIPPAVTNTSSAIKTSTTMEQHPIEDPSTEGSSSAEDETNTKIVSISPTATTKTSTDPLLVRLRRNFHPRSPTQKRGMDPQTDVDPIIAVGTSRTRLDP